MSQQQNESTTIRRTANIFYLIDKYTDDLCYREDILPIMRNGVLIRYHILQTVNSSLRELQDNERRKKE